VWRRIKGDCERWNDFRTFIEDVGERPEGDPAPWLRPIDKSKPIGPDNFFWLERKKDLTTEDKSEYSRQ